MALPVASIQLIATGPSTKDVRAFRDSALFEHGHGARTSQFDFNGEVMPLGDGVDKVRPITLRVLVNEATEALARADLNLLDSFNPEYLRRLDTGDYRAVYSPVLRINAYPIGQHLNQWVCEIVYLPMFPRWTTTQVNTISAYNSATKV